MLTKLATAAFLDAGTATRPDSSFFRPRTPVRYPTRGVTAARIRVVEAGLKSEATSTARHSRRHVLGDVRRRLTFPAHLLPPSLYFSSQIPPLASIASKFRTRMLCSQLPCVATPAGVR